MMRKIIIVLCVLASPCGADTLVASRTIRSQTILGPGDLTTSETSVPGALTRPDEAIGLEARVILYAGRPIRPSDVGPPAVIERNQIVTLRYTRGTLSIAADARALGRAAVGDAVRVMNLTSRHTVIGRVAATGEVVVGGALNP